MISIFCAEICRPMYLVSGAACVRVHVSYIPSAENISYYIHGLCRVYSSISILTIAEVSFLVYLVLSSSTLFARNV